MSVLCERERAGKDKRGKHQWWDVKHLLKARTCSVTQLMGVSGCVCVCVCVCERSVVTQLCTQNTPYLRGMTVILLVLPWF